MGVTIFRRLTKSFSRSSAKERSLKNAAYSASESSSFVTYEHGEGNLQKSLDQADSGLGDPSYSHSTVGDSEIYPVGEDDPLEPLPQDCDSRGDDPQETPLAISERAVVEVQTIREAGVTGWEVETIWELKKLVVMKDEAVRSVKKGLSSRLGVVLLTVLTIAIGVWAVACEPKCHVKEFLKSADLGEYYDNFTAKNYHLADLMSIQDAQELIGVGMTEPHLQRRFFRTVEQMNQRSQFHRLLLMSFLGIVIVFALSAAAGLLGALLAFKEVRRRVMVCCAWSAVMIWYAALDLLTIPNQREYLVLSVDLLSEFDHNRLHWRLL